MKNVPDIRFKGFEKELKKKQIGEIGYTYSGLTGKTKSDFGIGDCLYITFLNVLNNAIINSSILEKVNVCIDEKQNKVCKGDILFNTSSETPEELGMCAAVDEELIDVYLNSFCFGLRITDKEIDSLFFAYLMRSDIGRKIMKFLAQGATRYNLSKNNFYKTKLLLPETKAEQSLIASYFRQLDIQISEQEKRLEKLKQQKSACLISMFPQQGETIPRVRFKGFDGEWNEQKAEVIFRQFIEKNRPDLPVLSATQDRGMVTRKAIGYNISHDKRNECTYKHILPGQFVIHLRSFQGGFAHSDIEGIASPAYTVFEFRDKNQHNDIFWKYIFTSKSFIKQLEKITYGIRDGRSISFDEFKDMKFIIPCVKEQHQIASYFRNLDIQISEQEKRLEKLKQIKAACLDKMFV